MISGCDAVHAIKAWLCPWLLFLLSYCAQLVTVPSGPICFVISNEAVHSTFFKKGSPDVKFNSKQKLIYVPPAFSGFDNGNCNSYWGCIISMGVCEDLSWDESSFLFTCDGIQYKFNNSLLSTWLPELCAVCSQCLASTKSSVVVTYHLSPPIFSVTIQIFKSAV